jgi:hypothetical protein
MPDDKLTAPLQQSVLAALCFDQPFGATIAAQIRPEHFDSIYRNFATAVLAYRRRYGKPPGQQHITELAIGPTGRHHAAVSQLIPTLIANAEGLNAEYVASRTLDFVRRQLLKDSINHTIDRYGQDDEDMVNDVEHIFREALQFQQHDMDAGLFLNDPKGLAFVEQKESVVTLGLPELTRLNIGLIPKELLLYIASKGCLVGDTLIDCPRDLVRYPKGVPIRELVGKQFLTYSWDFERHQPCLSKVLDVWCSGRKPVYRVCLTASGSRTRARHTPPMELVGTFDHPVLLADGTWRKLGDLQSGDTLKSLYRRAESGRNNACCLSWTSDQEVSVREHRFICTMLYGPRGPETHAHHRDGNSSNNVPSNIEWKLGTRHLADHLAERTVVSVKYIGVRAVFDMEVEGTSNFVANGVFVHNSGKTWFCVHCGKQALLQRMKVVHISLEIDQLKVIRRYYQALFAVARRPDRLVRAVLEFDELNRLAGFRQKRFKPRLDFGNPKIRSLLMDRIKTWGVRFGGLVVKSFPTGFLTIDQLTGYLDYLEETQKFVPNVLIVDYPKLMRLDRKNLRIDLGHIVESLRGLGVQRNLALLAPHQGTRSTIGARRVTSAMAGEDISVVQTADTVLAYSRTAAEERMGLGRLSVEHARDSEGGSLIVMSQSYETGQYVLESAVMQQAYWERLRSLGGDGSEDE